MPTNIPPWQKSPTVGRGGTNREVRPAAAPEVDLAGPVTAAQGERIIALLEEVADGLRRIGINARSL